MNPNNYKYSVRNSILSDEQRKFYEENGYIVFRHLVDEELLEECRWVCSKLISFQILLLFFL